MNNGKDQTVEELKKTQAEAKTKPGKYDYLKKTRAERRKA